MAEIFVSGQISDIEYVRRVQQSFVDAGHHITHDWTHNETGDKLLAGAKAKLDNPEEAARRAQLDMQGVIDSDVYVICTDNEKPGKGMYVELGGALALNKTIGRPLVYLLGEMAHSSIFYFDEVVQRRASAEEIITEIEEV